MRITPIFGLTALALLGCGGDTGHVSVSMTTGRSLTASMDSDAELDDQLLLHVVRTEVHVSGGDVLDEDGDGDIDADDEALAGDGGGGWVVISEEARDVDLRTLGGTAEEIATGTVATGQLNQIRLVLDGATLVNADGERDVTVPSGSRSGLKLIIAPPIDVVSGSTTAVTLTVDGSFEHEAGDQYILRPTVKLSP